MPENSLTLSNGQQVKLITGSFKNYTQYTVILPGKSGSDGQVELFKDPTEGYVNALSKTGGATSAEVAMIKEAIDAMPM